MVERCRDRPVKLRTLYDRLKYLYKRIQSCRNEKRSLSILDHNRQAIHDLCLMSQSIWWDLTVCERSTLYHSRQTTSFISHVIDCLMRSDTLHNRRRREIPAAFFSSWSFFMSSCLLRRLSSISSSSVSSFFSSCAITLSANSLSSCTRQAHFMTQFIEDKREAWNYLDTTSGAQALGGGKNQVCAFMNHSMLYQAESWMQREGILIMCY